MELTEKEKKIIRDAKRAVKSFKKRGYFYFSVWLFLLLVALFGNLDLKAFICPSIIFFVLFSHLPGYGRGPKYSDLVNLLESKHPEKNEFESFMDVIKEANKT